MIDERLHTTDLPEVVRRKITRPFTQDLGNTYEILDVQPALVRLQPGELSRRDPHASRHLGLASSLRFAEVPQDATVHTMHDRAWLQGASMIPKLRAN